MGKKNYKWQNGSNKCEGGLTYKAEPFMRYKKDLRVKHATPPSLRNGKMSWKLAGNGEILPSERITTASLPI